MPRLLFFEIMLLCGLFKNVYKKPFLVSSFKSCILTV